jgi:hypothetical protein
MTGVVICGSEFIREEATTSDEFVLSVLPSSRMNSLPSFALKSKVQ